ncbi:Maf family protein [bacterium]|nr:Maf family protein [bacterium]
MQQLKPIILASASPRRKDLLQQMGLDFSVKVFPVNEQSLETDPEKKVMAIVKQKMDAAIKHLAKESVEKSCILCADTIVVVNNNVLGKARNKDEAKDMLQKLSGKEHKVMTAFYMHCHNDKVYQEVVITEVEFMSLTETMIDQYLCHDEYKDKAGSYAIQGMAGSYIKEIKGSYSNVIGLPQVHVLKAFEVLNVLKF